MSPESIDSQELEKDINSLLKIRELWDLINYDLNFWVEIAKKRAKEQTQHEYSWNLLGDMLWKLSPNIENKMLEIEEGILKLKNPATQEAPTITQEKFYHNSGKAIMEIALVIKITDTLKIMAKAPNPLKKEELDELIEKINCPLNSSKFQPPLEIIEKELRVRGI
jgi:hypothetical protein